MSALELRAALSLSSIFALRMLGLFVILPVFAIHARTLPGADAFMVGLVLGIYGLTQGVLQIPFGMASDRLGRKPVIIFGLLLFAVGSFLAAVPDDIWLTLLGRSLQGAGAISAAVTALLSDLTTERNRTKAMALIGATIGLSFAISLVFAPILFQSVGMGGIFIVTGVLALLAIGVVAWIVPAPPARLAGAEPPPRFIDVLADGELVRLNIGIFCLHMVLMAIFVVVPIALLEYGHMPTSSHWKVYLPAVLLSFLAMVPAIAWAERRGRNRAVLLASVAVMGLTQFGLLAALNSVSGIAVALFVYFTVFNILEAQLPSLVSRFAPPSAKGAALGVYNTTQALGLAAGGVIGGTLVKYTGLTAVFVFGAVMMVIWFIAAFSMREPAPRGAVAGAVSGEGELKHGLSQ